MHDRVHNAHDRRSACTTSTQCARKAPNGHNRRIARTAIAPRCPHDLVRERSIATEISMSRQTCLVASKKKKDPGILGVIAWYQSVEL